MLADVTPVILTGNEAPNIARTLAKLGWAKKIVVLDSFSEDETPAIARRFSNVVFFQRKFDNHSAQWNYALTQCGVDTEWVLALDADYVLTDDWIKEAAAMTPSTETTGYETSFYYRVFGRRLNTSLYPPVIVMYRRHQALYVQDGHTQRVVLSNKQSILKMRSKIEHDDRKPLSGWLVSQNRYMYLEAKKLRSSPVSSLKTADRIRLIPFLAPLVVAFYCLFIKGLLFRGVAGLCYTAQRVMAEWILSTHLMRQILKPKETP